MASFGNFETDIALLSQLMREHIETHALVEQTQEAIEAALEDGAAPSLARAALELAADLDAYLAHDLVLHIAKEEEVLFPAVMGFAADLDVVVEEMVEQHDEVRLRKFNIERALQAIAHDHDDVHAARSEVAAAAAAARASAVPAPALADLLDAVKRLSWILQGHFGDEEDDLFPPAAELLTPETWDTLAEQAGRLQLPG